jgi:hypothetical protein
VKAAKQVWTRGTVPSLISDNLAPPINPSKKGSDPFFFPVAFGGGLSHPAAPALSPTPFLFAEEVLYVGFGEALEGAALGGEDVAD